jgi:uncharacterized membrane protein (DUF4010 family)
MREDLGLALIVGALCGAAVGTERQWSGHAEGVEAHFGGLRTLTLLGALGGVSGWLWTHDGRLVGALLLVAAAALVVAGYAAVSRQDIDGTTEVAALVVLAAGVLAGIGEAAAASGLTAATVLLLVEKQRLHGLVHLLSDEGFRAGVRFAVMALVILPILPAGPIPALAGLRPRQLWLVVLLFSGLSFAGYVARAVVGARRGLRVTGLLGGLISSTSVTLTFARLSRAGAADGVSLAAGTIGACTVLFPRVVVAASILHPPLTPALARVLLVPFLVGVAATILAGRSAAGNVESPLPANPLQVRAAIQMAVVFHLVWLFVDFARSAFGDQGVLASAVATGVTDVDALTASLALAARDGLAVRTTVTAMAVGIAANTVLKLGLALGVGRGAFRLRTTGALAVMALVTLAAAVLGR